MLAPLVALVSSVTIPVYAAYSEPLPRGIAIEGRDTVQGWNDPSQSLAWYGESMGKGMITLSVTLASPSNTPLTLTVGKTRRTVRPEGLVVPFGSYSIDKGPVRVALSTKSAPGPQVASLQAEGNVRWYQNKRRNAASVHFRWPTPKDAPISWFYNEATMLTDPIWSYTMACGFARGYFGMQVTSPTERNVIFSVWDAGNEAVDRDKVHAENRVELVAKGDKVVTRSFGDEGTGGHSHVIVPWQTGKTMRFLVGARQEGDKTLYAGYFMAPGDKDWRLVAAFRAPKDGGPLRSLYSFSEAYIGDNGQAWRESAFGNGWIGLTDGTWQPLTKATFTTDDFGRKERWDFDAFIKGGRFHLRHGGFASGTAKYGDAFELPKAGRRPAFELPKLP